MRFFANTGARAVSAMAVAATLCAFGLRPASADPAPPTAAQILSQAKAATGGDAIAALKSIHYTQRVSVIGVSGTGQEWDDLVTGRTVSWQKLGAASAAQGFDGAVAWAQDATGWPHRLSGYADTTAALTQAYFTSFSEFVPGRRGAAVADPRTESVAGVDYDVLTIRPAGGLPTDAYFDPRSHLLSRIVTKYSPTLSFETDFSDYRTVDGVAIPYSVASSDSNGNSSLTTDVGVETDVDVAGRFTMPATVPADFTIAGGESTTFPIALINNHIYLAARVDGRGPYRFVFDTGGQALVDPDVATSLGILKAGNANVTGAGAGTVAGGVAWVPKIQVAGATLMHQSAGILPLGQVMQAIEGVHIDGMVGYELAARYLVTIDYRDSTMTIALRRPGVHPAGIPVPIVFDGSIPLVHAVVDGIPGVFDIDTGNRASLVLTAPFVAHHDLLAKYPSKVAGITGFGIGGPSRAKLTRVRSLQLGGITVPDVIAGMSLDIAGAMADPGQAGNIGGGFLKRFVVTFDYADGVMYLQPNSDYAHRESYDRSGLVLVAGHSGLKALGVLSGTPAADDGLKPGFGVIEVNGVSAKTLGLIGVRKILGGAAGTTVRLHILTAQGPRDVTLTLRDYV
jgi:hypothetical protein